MSSLMQTDRMTLKEKLQAMEELWADLCKRDENVPIPAWHKEILEERQSLVEQGKARFSSWESARKRLSKKMS